MVVARKHKSTLSFMRAIARIIQPETLICRSWFKGHQYELRRIWVQVGNEPQKLACAWFSDDGRRVSVHYRSKEMAVIHFGEFTPTEEYRSPLNVNPIQIPLGV